MKKEIVFVFICLILEQTAASLRSLFPDLHKQYSYVVKTNVSSGTLVPEASSSWTLEGRLLAQVYDNFTRVRYKLVDLKISTKSNDDLTYQSDAAEYLMNTWEVDYQSNGLINYIYVGSEPAWCVNMKRAISVNFQLARESQTVTTKEPCLYASCVVVYVIRGNKVHKYSSMQISSPSTERSWSSIPWSPDYTGRGVPDAVSTAEREYELDENKGLVSLEMKSEFQYRTHNHILSVASELSLYFDNVIHAHGEEKLDLMRTSVLYDSTEYTDDFNTFGGMTQNDLKNRTLEILLKIAKKGIDADNIVRNASLIHSLDFIDLLNTMARLNYDSLNKLFEDLVLGTSYSLETARNMFLEVLPHSRTDSCARFIKHLIVHEKEKVEDATLLSLIRKLPFNVANYSQALLEDLEVFTKLGLDYSAEIRHAGILSYATLLHKTMEANRLKQDYFDNMVVKYFRMYSDCPQYLDRMVWLQGLGNMGYSADSYTRTIYSDSGRDRHERLWAALADSDAVGRPYMVLETTLPILMNTSEHIQLRIASLHIFLSSDMRASDFLFVHNYIMECSNNQLKRFWYTTVRSLENGHVYNGYNSASYYVPFITNQVSDPDSTYWATQNYIISSEDTGCEFQLLTVGEEMGAFPALIGLRVAAAPKRKFTAALYVVAEGIPSNFYRRVRFYDDLPEHGVTKLGQILQEMKTVTEKSLEEVHIDVIIKVHGKTVYAHHINQTKFNSWNGEDVTRSVEDFLLFGSHINQQFVYYPYQMDVNIPNDLGTPIRLQSTILSFTSLRGNLTAPAHIKTLADLTWINDLHIRYQGTSVTSLSTAAPLLNTDHTARVQHSMVAHLPVKCNVTFSPVNRKLELKFSNSAHQNGGIAAHSRAQIATDSAGGRDAFTISAGENKLRMDESGVYFDCERPMSGSEVLAKLLTRENGYDIFPSLQPDRLLLNSIALLVSPRGSCGLILSPRRPADDETLQLALTISELTMDQISDAKRIDVEFNLKQYRQKNQDVLLDLKSVSRFETSGDNMINFTMTTVGLQPQAKDISSRRWDVCLEAVSQSYPSLIQDILPAQSPFYSHVKLIYSEGEEECASLSSSTVLNAEIKGGPSKHGVGVLDVGVNGVNLDRLYLLKHTDLAGDTAMGQFLRNIDKKSVNIYANLTEHNGIASLLINRGPTITFKSDKLRWMLGSWTTMQVMTKLGIYRQCRVQESTIETLVGTTDRLAPFESDESILLADCSKHPLYAVIRQKDGGVKVYAGREGSFVEMKKDSGASWAVVPKNHQDFIITTLEDTVKIESRYTGLQVYQRPHETVILVPSVYLSILCGPCMGQHDYNIRNC